MNKKTTKLYTVFLNRNLRYALLLGCLFFGKNAIAQTTHFVMTTAAGDADGTSWDNATSDLQLAINTAQPGDAIWVAAGTYKPNRKANDTAVVIENDRDNAFVLKEGVKIYGNFAGTETTLEERDILATINASILSGDFNSDDTIEEFGSELAILNNSENAYHVVISVGSEEMPVTAETVLDGFTIMGGNAQDTAFGNIIVNLQTINKTNGGGIVNSAFSSPAFTNVKITANAAVYGGGMYNRNFSSPVISNANIFNNTATLGAGITNWINASPVVSDTDITGNVATAGGGVYNFELSEPTFTNVSISQNLALTGSGGGVFNNASSPMFTNVILQTNMAGTDGGGIYNIEEASPVLNDVTLSINTAVNGGGIYNSEGSASLLTGVAFTGNSATTNGGGLYNINALPVLTDVTFEGNSAEVRGGGLYNTNASPQITDVVFDSNTAVQGAGIFNIDNAAPMITNAVIKNNISIGRGGGIHNDGSSPIITNTLIYDNTAQFGAGIYTLNASPVLTNLTITGNTATLNGGGMAGEGAAPLVRNSIIYGNSASASLSNFNFNTVTPVFYNSLVQGSSNGWAPIGTDGGGNIDTDPLFDDTEAESFIVSHTSPVIDAGYSLYFAEGQTPDLSFITADLAGNDRIFEDTAVDMGAYESDGELNVANNMIVNLSYYPNPVLGQLTINAKEVIEQVVVYNMLGQEVVNDTWNTQTGTINMASLKQGAYLVKIIAGNANKTVTVIKK